MKLKQINKKNPNFVGGTVIEMRGPITVCGKEEVSIKFGVEHWWMTKAIRLEMMNSSLHK